VPDGSLYTRERIVTNAHGGLRDSLKAARRAARGSSVARAAVNPPKSRRTCHSQVGGFRHQYVF